MCCNLSDIVYWSSRPAVWRTRYIANEFERKSNAASPVIKAGGLIFQTDQMSKSAFSSNMDCFLTSCSVNDITHSRTRPTDSLRCDAVGSRSHPGAFATLRDTALRSPRRGCRSGKHVTDARALSVLAALRAGCGCWDRRMSGSSPSPFAASTSTSTQPYCGLARLRQRQRLPVSERCTPVVTKNTNSSAGPALTNARQHPSPHHVYAGTMRWTCTYLQGTGTDIRFAYADCHPRAPSDAVPQPHRHLIQTLGNTHFASSASVTHIIHARVLSNPDAWILDILRLRFRTWRRGVASYTRSAYADYRRYVYMYFCYVCDRGASGLRIPHPHESGEDTVSGADGPPFPQGYNHQAQRHRRS
ncbi:unnamed protein product [Rangifer tarandus platyrhynchus]|uniref:Uncharacterized protein n=1 Tax=Rangifer tarandus platyrhynchus TaxID=3082113 RepID=A0ABN8XMY5_RANTA|nr:unnamed protein product [Rangifer tarandus platyrhynchus]